MTTIAARIASVLAARLADIKVINGYETDAGLRVYRGRLLSSPEDLGDGPVVTIYPRDAVPTERPIEDALEERVRHELHLSIIGQALPDDDDHPMDTGWALMGDIKRSIFRSISPLIEGGERISEAPEHAGARLAMPEPGERTAVAIVDVTVRYFQQRNNPSAT